MKKKIIEIAVTVVGCLLLGGLVAHFYQPHKPTDKILTMKCIPGEVGDCNVKRVNVVDDKGNVVLSLYAEEGLAKMEVKTGKDKKKTLDLASLANRLSGFLGE